MCITPFELIKARIRDDYKQSFSYKCQICIHYSTYITMNQDFPQEYRVVRENEMTGRTIAWILLYQQKFKNNHQCRH